ncbi:MAG: DUF2157 domain-containing protein [Gemmatimonadota bacterium]
MKDLEARLARWVEAGLVTEEQASAIRATERAEGAASGSSLAATALGYLGASVALVGGVVAASRSWSEMGTGSRLALAGGATLLLLVAGWVARRCDHPALRSLDGFLWFLSAGGAAFTAGLVGHDVLEMEGRSVVLLAGSATALWALPLWRIRPGPLQEIAVVVGLAVFVEALLHHLPGPPDELHGLPLWGLGAVWALLAWGRLLPERRSSFPLAGVALLLGAQILSFGWRDAGLALGVGTAVTLLAASVGLKSMLPLGFGAAGVLLFLPQIVFEYLGDTLGVPLALLVCGVALLGAALLTARLKGTVREEVPAESRVGGGRDRRRAAYAAIGTVLVVAGAVWVFGVAPLPDYPSLAAHPDPSIPGRVAFLRWGTAPCLFVVPASGGEPRRLRCANGEEDADWLGGPLGWTGDGRIVVQAFGPSGPRALVLDPETGRVIERIQIDEPLFSRPLPADGSGGPAGARLLVNRSDRAATLGIAPPEGSPLEVARVTGPPGYAFTDAHWSSDGEWILIRDSNQNLLVARAREGAPVWLLAERVTGPYAWHVPGLAAHAVDLDSLRAAAR